MKTEHHSRTEYFAYGSNMLLPRIEARGVSAIPVALAELTGYELRLHKKGKDGSAKCNAFFTGRSADVVYGVVFSIRRDDVARLDLFEGVNRGYVRREVSVKTDVGVSKEVVTYFAQADYLDDSLKPFSWYRDIVLMAASEYGFPEGYRRRIEQIEVVQDPDSNRELSERRALDN